MANRNVATKLTVGIVLLFAVTTTATADLVPIGDPIIGDSWSQKFALSGIGSFDLMAVRMVSADFFSSPTFSVDPSPPVGTIPLSWNDFEPDTQHATTYGSPSVSDITFFLNFAGDISDNLEFDFVAFLGETKLESKNLQWIWDSVELKGAFTVTAGAWDPSRGSLIPLPAPVLLGLAGLGGMAWYRRRHLS